MNYHAEKTPERNTGSVDRQQHHCDPPITMAAHLLAREVPQVLS